MLRASLVAQTVKSLPAMWETWVQSLGREDSLEAEMTIHSSILVWRLPWTEEPGRLQSRGLLKSRTRLSGSHTHTPGLMVLFPVLFLHHLLSLSARHPFVFLDQGSADILGPKRDCFQLCSNDPLPQDSPKSAWTAWTGKCGVSQ